MVSLNYGHRGPIGQVELHAQWFLWGQHVPLVLWKLGVLVVVVVVNLYCIC